MNRKINRKLVLTALAFITALLSMLTVNGTLAWITAGAGNVENTFAAPSTPISVNESVSGDVKSNVSVANNGDVSCYIRAILVPIWRSSDGTGTGLTAEEGVDYTISLGGGWTKSGEYYYYNNIVNPGENTTDLYQSVTVLKPESGNIKADKTLELQIIASSVQARGWPDSVYASSVPALAAFESAANGIVAGEADNYPSNP